MALWAGRNGRSGRSGFPLAEDHMRVWRPQTGETLARGPVVTWASRSKGRQLSSRFFASLARVGLHGLDVARIAVHPGDTTVPELISSIRRPIPALPRVAVRPAMANCCKTERQPHRVFSHGYNPMA
jgi:hypothetical protein